MSRRRKPLTIRPLAGDRERLVALALARKCATSALCAILLHDALEALSARAREAQ